MIRRRAAGGSFTGVLLSGTVFTGTPFTGVKFGEVPGAEPSEGTYWTTAQTDRWNTAQTGLWTTTMDTEIP